ncbi:kinase [Thraustotheca clavata]|uniref:Kinase n=1 Tax=Thraustotheca clavata TaxID=74557 RepID=A0A1V9Z9K7_9STRA|nr:kinase [Thraustotheca clavata]
MHKANQINRDLKSENILPSVNNGIKVCDLGVSRELEPDMTKDIGTPYWMTPEVIGEDCNYDCRAVIYSFGVILTELDTLTTPYSDYRNKGLSWVLLRDKFCRGELRLSLSENCEPWLKALAYACLMFNPGHRPTAKSIIDTLQPLVHQESLMNA